MPIKLDRLDVDAMLRIRETEIWRDYEARIRVRAESAMRTCANGSLEEKTIRLAQGEVAALQFVLGLPDLIQKEIARQKDAG